MRGSYFDITQYDPEFIEGSFGAIVAQGRYLLLVRTLLYYGDMDPNQPVNTPVAPPTAVPVQNQPTPPNTPPVNASVNISPVKRILLLFVAGFIHLLLTMASTFLIGGLASILFSDAFSNGFSGLALGLALKSILLPIEAILPAVAMGFLLRKLAYKYAFLMAFIAGITMVFLFNIWHSSADLVPESKDLWYVIFSGEISAWLLVCISYLLAYGIVSLKKKIFIAASLIILFPLLFSLSIQMNILNGQHYRAVEKEKSINRGFEVYETTSEDITLHNPYSPEYIYHVESRLEESPYKTETVDITQSAEDAFIKKYLTDSNKCNYDVLTAYISSGGSKSKAIMPDNVDQMYDCKVLYQAEDRILLKSFSTYSSPYPYVAKINNTVLTFDEPGVGNPKGNVENYIIDFVRNARVITNKELGLE